jgi:hypothetical protein
MRIRRVLHIQSFAHPLTDEFLFRDSYWTRQIDAGLSTQTSLNFDCGIRHAFNEYFSTDLIILIWILIMNLSKSQRFRMTLMTMFATRVNS